MALIPRLTLFLLGLAIGFVITWAIGAGTSSGLFVGLLLLVAGAIIGFVSEWLIDEAHRKNRELQRQLQERERVAASPVIQLAPLSQLPSLEPIEVAATHRLNPGERNHDSASETLAIYMHQRDEELRDIRQQMATTDVEMDRLRKEFEAYQRTHPDNLTLIKGIGSVYQWKLRDVGISTYRQLAAADPAQVRRMLDVKKW
ncbi:MAG TPA: hypothetical protein VEC93_05125, partial [Anaerolineae bacterium]|nr:hypothetical protein [Anaerolineae bacterium]